MTETYNGADAQEWEARYRCAMDRCNRLHAALAESRETVARLNRRCQIADAAVAEKWKPMTPSFGKGILRYAYEKETRRADAAEAALARLREAAWAAVDVIEGLDLLLVAYRLGRNPAEIAWKRLENKEAKVKALRAELGEGTDAG